MFVEGKAIVLFAIEICELRAVLNIFRNFSPYSVIVLFLFAIGFKLYALLHPLLPVTDNHQVAWNWIIGFFHYPLGQSAFAFTFFALVNSFGQALFVNKIATSHHLFSRSSYLPAVSYLLVSSIVPSWNYFSAPLMANWLVLLVISSILQLYATQEPRKKLFNIGCYITIASLIHLPCVYLLPVLLWSLAVLRPFKVAEWVTALLGIITPLYFLAGILFLADSLPQFKLLGSARLVIPRHIQQPQVVAGVAGVALILSVTGLFQLQQFMSRMVMQPRKLWGIIIIAAFLALPAVAFTVGTESNQWLVTLPAASFIFTNAWIRERKKWMAGALFYLCIAVLIFVQWFAK